MAGIIKEISKQDASELVELATRTFYDTFGSYYDDNDFDQFFKDNYTVEKFTQEINHVDSFHYFYQEDGANVGYIKMNINSAQTEEMGGDLFRSTAHILFERLSRWWKRFTIDSIGRKNCTRT